MEARTRAIGDRGEERACRYLKARGYWIVDRNWRCRFGEIDIIAWEKETLVFVEVKARTRGGYGTPEEAVGPWKRRRLIASARLYLARFGGDPPVRFDVLTVTRGGVESIRDAFAVEGE